MVSSEFVRLVERLCEKAVDAQKTLTLTQQKEEWTKFNFIVPVLEGLGWDKSEDLDYEGSSEDDEGALDFTIWCQPPIGIEAKALHVKPPPERSHPQITKGLQQAQVRGASYFIWTNGDCWQFFSLALPDAPIYSLTLSDAHENRAQLGVIASEFNFLQKESFSADPQLFDQAILKKWKTAALPAALEALLNKRMADLVQLLRRELPRELHIEDDEIESYLSKVEPPSPPDKSSPGPGPGPTPLSFPEDWEKLLNSYEPKYEESRRRFRQGYYPKLAHYLISDQYSPWSKRTTWRLVGASKDTGERKKLGNVVALFRKWHFIEEIEGTDRYQRVDDSVEYLKKLIEEPANP